VDQNADRVGVEPHLPTDLGVAHFLNAPQPEGLGLAIRKLRQLVPDAVHQFVEHGLVDGTGAGRTHGLHVGRRLQPSPAPSSTSQPIQRPPRSQPSQAGGPVVDLALSGPLERLAEHVLVAVQRFRVLSENPIDRPPHQRTVAAADRFEFVHHAVVPKSMDAS